LQKYGCKNSLAFHWLIDYEVYVKLKIAEGLRAVKEGRVYTHEQVVEDMWKIIDSKSPGASQRSKTSRKSLSAI
jgi:predicted transcriptional regulator